MYVKELRKILRVDFNKEYTLKTKTYNSLEVKVANIYKEKEHIVGADANVYSKDQINKHRKIFELYKRVKKEGLYDKDGKKISL